MQITVVKSVYNLQIVCLCCSFLCQISFVHSDTEIKEDYDEFGSSEEIRQSYEYELTGVTVHTGTAEGGHYYSFILDKMNKNEQGQAKWYVCLITFYLIELTDL